MKKALAALIITFFAATSAYAVEDALETLYGHDLLNVPAAVRLKFENETHASWYDVAYNAKYEFLTKWEESKKATLKAQAEQDKKKAAYEKLKAAAAKDRALKAKARAQAEKERQLRLAKEKRDREKQVADMKRKREDQLRELRKWQKFRNR